VGRRINARHIPGRLALTGAIAFTLYLVVYRPLQLHWGASEEEVTRSMPGDEIQPRPIFDATRAVTIQAPPEQIWPWLAQIGYRRAGWYSGLDWLDNDGVASADRVVPELQHLMLGDSLPIWRDITHRIVAASPNEYMLASSPSGRDSWLWALVPVDGGHTRLIWRMRHGPYEWTSPLFLVRQLATDLGDFVVVRNILLGIRERAEGRPLGSLAASTVEVVLWLSAFGAFLATLVGLVVRGDWLRPLLAVMGTCAATLLLVFSMPPVWADALAVVAIYGALRPEHRRDDAPRADHRIEVAALPCR
jgi:Polyketide cyclase / dehydrase and lipid transport